MNTRTIIMRLGKLLIIGVFLYFGIDSILNPENFVNILPMWVSGIIDPTIAVILHGMVEVICALFILFGLGGNWPKYILIFAFLGVLISVSGTTQIRDFGIFGGLLLLLVYSLEDKKMVHTEM